MPPSDTQKQNNTGHPRPQTSLLKILGFILLVGSVTLVSCQSAMLASWA
ncbi:MAG: hypothetical protein V3V09_08615 [Arenicellales bacterium]